MTKPALPLWARDELAGQIVTPPGAKIQNGWNANEPAAAQFANWLQNKNGIWLTGLQHQYADIVVGTTAQVTAKEATHEIDDFVAAVVNGDTIVLLGGQTHALAQNEAITENNLRIILEPTAILDDGASRTLTLSGSNISVIGGSFTGFGTDAIILSGNGYVNCGGLTDSSVNVTGDFVVISNGARLGRPNFRAYLATSQLNITGPEKVLFDGIVFDVTGDFDFSTNHRFQPSTPGKYRLFAKLRWSNISTVAGDRLVLKIEKNGSDFVAQDEREVISANWHTTQWAMGEDEANGTTDYYEVTADNADRNTSDLAAATYLNFFSGNIID